MTTVYNLSLYTRIICDTSIHTQNYKNSATITSSSLHTSARFCENLSSGSLIGHLRTQKKT